MGKSVIWGKNKILTNRGEDMGIGYHNKCEKCGYVFNAYYGYGMRFATVYKETMEKAKKGNFGEEVREVLEKNEDAAIDCEEVVLCCEECGHLENNKDLTLYVRDKRKMDAAERVYSVLGVPKPIREYETHSNLVDCYTEIVQYPHKCVECGEKMKIMEKDDELLCPKCKIPLVKTGYYCWD